MDELLLVLLDADVVGAVVDVDVAVLRPQPHRRLRVRVAALLRGGGGRGRVLAAKDKMSDITQFLQFPLTVVGHLHLMSINFISSTFVCLRQSYACRSMGPECVVGKAKGEWPLCISTFLPSYLKAVSGTQNIR